MNNWEGNTLLYQSAGTDSEHRTFLPVPPPSDQHVNRALKVSHSRVAFYGGVEFSPCVFSGRAFHSREPISKITAGSYV